MTTTTQTATVPARDLARWVKATRAGNGGASPMTGLVLFSGGVLRATDMHHTVTVAASGLDVEAVVPAGPLLLAVAGLDPARDATVTVDAPEGGGGGTLTVRQGRTRATIPLPTTDLAAALPGDPPADALTVTIADPQVKRITDVASCASRDDTRPVLTGVLVTWDDTSWRATATDSYRLVDSRGPHDGTRGAGERRVLLPGEALRMLPKDGDLTVTVVRGEGSSTRLVLTRGEVSITCPAIDDGQVAFPNPDNLIPGESEWTMEARFTADAAAEVMRLLQSSPRGLAHGPIAIELTKGESAASVSQTDTITGVTRVVEASLEEPWAADSIKIGANPEYLGHMLTLCSPAMRFITHLRPMRSDGDGITMVLMPVRIGGDMPVVTT